MSDQPITNNKSGNPISRDEALRLVEKMAKELAGAMGHGGARVNVGVQDQRFTKLINWVWASIGIAFIGISTYGVQTIQDLNVKVGILISQREQDVQERRDLREDMKDSNKRIGQLENRIGQLEGRK